MIRRYTVDDASLWDAFIRGSRNGTFLFERGYMDYHADRFEDCSLLFVDEKQRLLALLPANRRDEVLYSHQGLTYGGLILAPSVTMHQVMEMFDELLAYARAEGIREIVYKPMPDIYHRSPSQEEEYALWRLGAEMESCLISTTIDLQEQALPVQAQYCRRNTFSRLSRQGYSVDWEAPLAEFWPILEENLSRKYGVAPVHTLAEIERLQQRFPDQILCVVARNPEGKALGGVVMFETEQVAHVQYSSASPEGREVDILDFLYLSLIRNYQSMQEFRFFDIGNSNEEHGRYLNEALIHFKESFGGRGVVYRSYRLRVP